MKATGIVRRIDDLGRVVIPKEIRRTLRLREGDPLEIYTGNDGDVIFKKYSPIGELQAVSTRYAEVLYKISGYPILICDADQVVSAAGIPKRETLEKRISAATEELMEKRKLYLAEMEKKVRPIEGLEKEARVISPILVGGDVCGCVIMLQGEQNTPCEKGDMKLVTLASGFIARQMEE